MLNEATLAKELGISRTPLREALLELSVQGLVKILPRKGVQVNYFTEQDVEEVFELRRIIELAAVDNITRLTNPQPDFSQLQKTLHEQRRASKEEDYIAFLRADNLFHKTLCDFTGNNRIVAIMKDLWSIIRMMGLQALERPRRWEQILDEHEAIIKAMKQKDRNGAMKAMECHLEQSKEGIFEQLRVLTVMKNKQSIQ
jgi:DNA-binding GntR family transcriptional regulator